MSDVKVVRYEPRGAARSLFSERAPEVLVSGPAGTGKSLACLYRLHLACLKYEGIKCLIVRKTAVSLTSTTLDSYRKKVAQHALRGGIVRWYGGSGAEPAAFRYTNGSEIRVGGMDRPEKVLSSEYDLIFVDEANELTITDWEILNTRLRNGVLPWQQQIAACNPNAPTHWLKARADEGRMTHLKSTHRDNPAYMNQDGTCTPAGEAFLARLDNMTGVRRLRLRDGVWASAEGLVFETYDDSVHVIDDFEIPSSWRRYWSIDFGYTNPFVCQWWAEDEDGRLYLYREWYQTRTLVEDHARKILSIVTDDKGNWTEPKPTRIICDHDAEDRATLERHVGRPTVPAIKKVSEGIQAVSSRMKVQPDGRARLYLLRSALVKRDSALDTAKKPCSTQEEINGYVWDIAEGKQPKESPVKADDHGCDAMRYMVAERDLGVRPGIRVFNM